MNGSKFSKLMAVSPMVCPATERALASVSDGAFYAGRIPFLNERSEREGDTRAVALAGHIRSVEGILKDMGFPTPPDFAAVVTEYALEVCANEAG